MHELPTNLNEAITTQSINTLCLGRIFYKGAIWEDECGVGEDLENLITLSTEELLQLYPEQNEKNIIRRKQEYRKKLRMDERKLAKEWTVAAYDKADQEWKYATNQSFVYEQNEERWQASPAKITPTRRKSVDRDYKTIFVFSDLQAGYRRVMDYDTKEDLLLPLHDERAMKVARFICRDLQPETIVNLGDTYDAAEFSRFAPDSTHFHNVTAPTLQRIHNYYGELRADNPNARIVEVDSNHNVRLDKAVLGNLPQLADFTRPGDNKRMLTYEYMTNLDHVGVEFVSGYGAAEFEYSDDLAFMHGTIASKAGTARKLSAENPDRNVVQGHAHRVERYYRTDRRGRPLGAFVVGALCKTDGTVPSYHNGVAHDNMPVHYQEDWQQSVMVVKDYGDGHYQFDDVIIIDGKAHYDGKEYRADV